MHNNMKGVEGGRWGKNKLRCRGKIKKEEREKDKMASSTG